MAIDRLLFFQSDEGDRRQAELCISVYVNNRCCYCFRPTKPGARLLRTARTNDGEWWIVSADCDMSAVEWRDFQDQLDGTFKPTLLPIGPDCLRDHPEFRIGLVDVAHRVKT